MITNTVLKKLSFTKLKNIRNVDIDFTGSPLVALMGVNGCGKSTILHAIACCYSPRVDLERENYKFSRFFTPNSDALWSGSEFKMIHDYRDGRELHTDKEVLFSKQDRWTPKYDRRPQRHVVYIGVDTCVPTIEQEKKESMIRYSTSQRTDAISNLIMEKAGFILNRRYNSYNENTTPSKVYIGVEHNGTRYSSLSMGAGEQRVFKILDSVFTAPDYSMILVDEIDLLMHTYALKRMIRVLHQRALEKKLQIIFTTHSEIIIEMEEWVTVRHIHQLPDKTICFTDSKPETLYRLTGNESKLRQLEIFVEDDLAVKIVDRVCSDLGMKQFTSINRYGAAVNCFTLVSGMLLQKEDLTTTLFVMDGDVFASKEDKQRQISRILTGTSPESEEMRNSALSNIKQFNLPDGYSPEQYIWESIRHIPEEVLSYANEVKRAALEIDIVDENHQYVNAIINRMGYNTDRNSGLMLIMDIFSKSREWENFISPIKSWLNGNREVVAEVLVH